MEQGQPLAELAAEQRELIVRKWLARTLQSYPKHTVRFLLEDKDPFRNPVGRALREGFPLLLDEVTGAFDSGRIQPVLDEIIHIHAVQDISASQAVGFIFDLKPILREQLDPRTVNLDSLDRRVDELALLAFDLFMRCREKTYEIRMREARRRVYLIERAAAAKARS